MTEDDKSDGLREELDDQQLDEHAGGTMVPPVVPITVSGPCNPVLTVIVDDTQK